MPAGDMPSAGGLPFEAPISPADDGGGRSVKMGVGVTRAWERTAAGEVELDGWDLRGAQAAEGQAEQVQRQEGRHSGPQDASCLHKLERRAYIIIWPASTDH